ncbi:MAG TPA: VOC family protein [Thermoplasmata archaeon]|jgi:predicted enzyme related to lactoylglutathione lyase|nr:VOC family protein [Thermoplasmata archaeon]
MPHIVEGLHAVTLHVTDLAKARNYYANVLGLEEEILEPNAPRVVFQIPGCTTRLSMHVQGEGEGGREPGTVSGIVFLCADPVAACATIRARGGTVTNEPWSMKRGDATIVRAVIADPDGNELMLSS